MILILNYCLIFCETEKNKRMVDKYVKIIYEIEEQTLFIIEDENEGKNFIKIL